MRNESDSTAIAFCNYATGVYERIAKDLVEFLGRDLRYLGLGPVLTVRDGDVIPGKEPFHAFDKRRTILFRIPVASQREIFDCRC